MQRRTVARSEPEKTGCRAAAAPARGRCGVQSYREGMLLNVVIHSGHLEIVEWLYTHRRDRHVMFHRSATEIAARNWRFTTAPVDLSARRERSAVVPLYLGEDCGPWPPEHLAWIHEVQADVDVKLTITSLALRCSRRWARVAARKVS